MVEDRLYPCTINGKYYAKPVDFDKLVSEQADKIIEDLESKLENSSSKVYHDEGFRQYIESVRNGDIEAILHPDNPFYKSQFELAVLEFGSYELVQRLLITSSDKEANDFLEELDQSVFRIQDALTTFCVEQRQQRGINYTKKMQKIYRNFLENFAPQRLPYYTEPPVNVKMLAGMMVLKEESLKSFMEADATELVNLFSDFNNIYRLDVIIQLISLYQKLAVETDMVKQNELSIMIDNLTKNGISVSGNTQAIMNFVLPNSTQTMNQMIENFVFRPVYYHHSDKLDISEDFDTLLQKYAGIKSFFTLDQIYGNDSTFHKLLQLSRLNILPEKEKKKLNEYLDHEFGRKDIPDIDMTKFDQKIESREKFSSQEVMEFYQDVIQLTVKQGIMPAKYNEFLISKLLENNPEFIEALNDNQKEIIVEHFASMKSKQLFGDSNYITFSTHFFDHDGGMTLGLHQPGLIKLRPIEAKNQSMTTLLNIITIFHELRHEQQQRSMDSQEYNHLIYMMEKERIFTSQSHSYYNKNYSTIYEELDAEHYALDRTLRFVKTLPLGREFHNSQNCQEMLRYVEARRDDTMQGFQRASTKEMKDGKIAEVEEAFDELIAQNPEVLKKKPIFRVEYNEDGTRKPVSQIFQEFINVMRFPKNRLGNYDLYKYVLLSRAGRDLEECIKLTEIDIPKDLTPSTRNALEKMRYVAFFKGIGEPMPESKQPITLDEETEEKITPEAQSTYQEIFGEGEDR